MLARWLQLLLLLVLASVLAAAQVSLVLISAGTPEDQAIQEITKEADTAKQAAMWEEFVQKFAASPAAVAYGHAQLAQQAMVRGDRSEERRVGKECRL